MDQCGSEKGDKKLSSSGYISKVKLAGFTNILHWSSRERWNNDDSISYIAIQGMV